MSPVWNYMGGGGGDGEGGGVEGGGAPSPVSPPHTMLDLTMCHQQVRCYFHSALRAFHLPPMALPKRWTLLRRLLCINLLLYPTWRVAWLA